MSFKEEIEHTNKIINNKHKKEPKNKKVSNIYKETPHNNSLKLEKIEKISTNTPFSTSPFFIKNNYDQTSQVETKNTDEKILFSKNNILQSFKSQQLTRNLQKSLINASKEIINYIINELKGNFKSIIKNNNGNYFCSNLIKICNKENRIQILKELSDTLSDDCIDIYGTYPIQNLIELSSGVEEFQLILSSFKDLNKILMISLHHHGTYIIQKIIKHIPEDQRSEFNSLFVQLVIILSRDTYGAYALEKFICYTKSEKIEKEILNSIKINFMSIATNKNGNYVIQSLLEKWWNNKKSFILKKIIMSKFQILANNEYSSHICDLFTKLSNNEITKKED